MPLKAFNRPFQLHHFDPIWSICNCSFRAVSSLFFIHKFYIKHSQCRFCQFLIQFLINIKHYNISSIQSVINPSFPTVHRFFSIGNHHAMQIWFNTKSINSHIITKSLSSIIPYLIFQVNQYDISPRP